MDQIVPVRKRKSLDGEDQSFAREVEWFLLSLCLNTPAAGQGLK